MKETEQLAEYVKPAIIVCRVDYESYLLDASIRGENTPGSAQNSSGGAYNQGGGGAGVAEDDNEVNNGKQWGSVWEDDL